MTRRLLFALLPGLRIVAPAFAERFEATSYARWRRNEEEQLATALPADIGITVELEGYSGNAFLVEANATFGQPFFIAPRALRITGWHVNWEHPVGRIAPASPVITINGTHGDVLKAGDRLSVTIG